LANLSKPRPQRQRRQSNIFWRTLGGALGIVLALGLYVRWLSLPWSLGAQTNREVRQLEARLRDRHAENVRYAQHLAYLKSAEGIEAIARSRGYHRPGETVYLQPREKKNERL
jgi:cell division protein FtsL